MANITASDVNKLRQVTGVGMMDCKKALVEADGDFDKAIEILRKKGQKVAANRQDRVAKEGYVIAKTSADNKRGIVISLNCETDFVAKNQEFIDYAVGIADTALNQKPATLDELMGMSVNGKVINDIILELLGKIGEKIELSTYEQIDAPMVAGYNHPGNRLATLIGFSKDNVGNLNVVGREIAMQVAAMSPVAIDKEDVDPKIIEREIEIGKEQARNEGKPEQMLEKIALGKLNKFYNDCTLLNQEFVRDHKKTIRQYLAETDREIKITAFKRVQVG
jgi:elongation factor Ts